MQATRASYPGSSGRPRAEIQSTAWQIATATKGRCQASVGRPAQCAFLIALATGMVEPLGGLIGATAVGFSDALLPWGLAFAAGAMLFVISGEIIPETHRNGKEHRATLGLVAGFVVMMILDQAVG